MPNPRFDLTRLGYGKKLHMEFAAKPGRLVCIGRSTGNLVLRRVGRDLSLTQARNRSTCKFCKFRANRLWPRKARAQATS